MVVLQGKTVGEIHTLYQQCVDMGFTHFSFNHASVVYQELGGSENTLANQSVGRVLLIQYLLSQGVIKDHHYIHLLGASTPQEFVYYRDMHPQLINSVDTTNDQAFAGYVISNDAALAAEVAARAAADTAISSSLVSEIARATAAEAANSASFATDLTAEAAARVAADCVVASSEAATTVTFSAVATYDSMRLRVTAPAVSFANSGIIFLLGF